VRSRGPIRYVTDVGHCKQSVNSHLTMTCDFQEEHASKQYLRGMLRPSLQNKSGNYSYRRFNKSKCYAALLISFWGPARVIMSILIQIPLELHIIIFPISQPAHNHDCQYATAYFHVSLSFCERSAPQRVQVHSLPHQNLEISRPNTQFTNQ
jgi:hypothetical protein